MGNHQFMEAKLMANSTRKPNNGAKHEADIKNSNKGTDGNNVTNGKANGNKGKQNNPNQK
jgi:hypothetical protein